MKNLRKIFEKSKTIAVYGMSKNPDKPAQLVPAYFVSQDYNVVPINPSADEIIGIKCHKNLSDISERIDILDVFRPSEEAVEVVKEAIERRKIKGDIDVIWLQEGIVSDTARELAEKEGIIFIQDKCLYKEYVKVFPERD
ncbi:MAG: CoA-binding protein [Candidatus Schekmanbacteria bacterium]|nr:CoA-binding protein [Candidatus Schekmanbacteria bacterium]